jgi:hypothetical protein
LDEYDPEIGKDIKNKSKPMHKYCSDSRNLVRHLVFMNKPLYRPKWKRNKVQKDDNNSDWSDTDEEPEPAEPLANESDPSDYTKNGSGLGPNAEPDETPCDTLTEDAPLAPLPPIEDELEEEPDPAQPLQHEDYEEDYRDRSGDPGKFEEV